MTHGTAGSGRRFADRVAVVTGGNRGIGLATGRALASEGAKVLLMGRDATAGARAAASIDGASFFAGDVRSAEDCTRAVEEAVRLGGHLDLLVNSAGVIYRNRTLEEHTEEEWDHTFDTNVKGTFLMCRAALPWLRAQRGAIVTVASYVGLVGFPGSCAYAASKAAIINMTRTIALDHAAEGLRANCVCPGSVDTEMIHDAWRQTGDAEAAARAWASKHPVGRIATPEEVARAILFLASDEASFVTGVALPVDGGITAG